MRLLMIELMDKAISSDHGVVVRTDNRKSFEVWFYKIRKERGSPFTSLSLSVSPYATNEVWMLKNAKNK